MSQESKINVYIMAVSFYPPFKKVRLILWVLPCEEHCLVKSKEGTAITYIRNIKINNKKLAKVSHEYSHIEDVEESINEIIFNLKQIVLN